MDNLFRQSPVERKAMSAGAWVVALLLWEPRVQSLGSEEGAHAFQHYGYR